MTVVGNYPLRCGGRMFCSLPIPHCECGGDLVEAPAAEAESYVKTGIWVAVTTLLLRGMSSRRRCCEKTPSIHSSQTPLRHSCVHTSFLSNSRAWYLSFNHTNSLTGLWLTYLPSLQIPQALAYKNSGFMHQPMLLVGLELPVAMGWDGALCVADEEIHMKVGVLARWLACLLAAHHS